MTTKYSSDYASSGGGSSVLKIQNLTSDGIVNDWSYLALADASALTSNLIITLPLSTANSIGKTVTIKKTDSSNNPICIKSNGIDTIDGSNTNQYLYGKGDCVTIASTEIGKCEILPDNRNSTGSSNSFLRATATSELATFADNTVIPMNTNEIAIGLNITNNVNGTYTLNSGSSYTITSDVRVVTGTNVAFSYVMEKSINSGTSWTQIGNIAKLIAPSATNSWASSTVATASVIATVPTLIRVKVKTAGTATGIGEIAQSTGFPYIEIEEISRQATIINTVGYLNAKPTNVIAQNSDIPLTILDGDMKYSSPYIWLEAGKTYELDADLCFRGAIWANYGWFDDSTIPVQLPNSSIGCNGALNATDVLAPTQAYASITPSSTIRVKLRTVGMSTSTDLDISHSFVKVRQIGSTACTKVPMNLIDGISDNTSSKYIDIGNVRMQWGLSSTGGDANGEVTITFPAPFANTSYSFTGTIKGGSNTYLYTVFQGSRTTTAIHVLKKWQNMGTSGVANEPVDYIAIGLKP